MQSVDEYILYCGDTYIYTGTIAELAALTGVKEKTIRFYTTPSYARRIAKRKNARNYITVTRLED